MPNFPQALIELMDGQQNDHSPPLPMLEAQRDHMADLVAAARIPDRFEMGDAVTYKVGTGPNKPEIRETMWVVFWRYLEPHVRCEDVDRIKSADHTEKTTLPTIDCLLAFFDGRNTHFDPGCSALLERRSV